MGIGNECLVLSTELIRWFRHHTYVKRFKCWCFQCYCTCKRESQSVYTRNVSTQISLQSLWQNYMYLISSVLVNLTFVSAMHVHDVQFQGSRDDAVLRALASQQSAGPIPRLSVIHCMWVQFVVSCDLCSKRFSSGYSSFPFSSKANTSKFQFDLESVPNYM